MIGYERNPTPLYCVLAYNPDGILALGALTEESAFLVAHFAASGLLMLFVHPKWQSMVREEDYEYLGELLGDFKERSLSDPECLMRQISSLNIGLIATLESGADASRSSVVASLLTRFSELGISQIPISRVN